MTRIEPTAYCALALLLLLGLPLKGIPQELRIKDVAIDSGNLRLSFIADTNWYYLLERAGEPSQTFAPTAMLLPAVTNGIFQDKIDRAQGFYRLQAVPLTAPLDIDADGVDDVYELRRQPALDPLDPADANQDLDGDGFTQVQEYRGLLFDEGARRIGVGENHFLILRSDGALWACGDNGFGQLGDGSTNSQAELIPIEVGTRWKAVAAGGYRAYGIQMDGSLWAWGRGSSHLGDGINTNHLLPTRIGLDNDWKSLVASHSHTLAIKQDGALWGWGANGVGQLGDGSHTTHPTPVRIGNENNWTSVEVGQNVTLALRMDGRLFACGHNERGQLGIGVTNLYADVLTPVASNFTWQAIGCGDFHGLGIRSDHTLWAWGQLYEDAGGGSVRITNRWGPTQIGTNSNWLRVTGGYQHSAAIDADGFMWAFGFNTSGQTGVGNQLPQPVPTRIAAQDRWISFGTKWLNHLGIRKDGTLWNWTTGFNWQFTGASGLFSPVMPGRRFRSIAAGDFHSLAVDEFGTVWTWGANEAGQLGDRTTDSGLPRQLATNINCTSVSAGGGFSMAIDRSAQLWLWGSYPTLAYGPPGSRGWAAAAGGGLHWLALDLEGRLMPWGDNSHSQLPNTADSTNVFVAIDAGGRCSLAIDQGGSLYVWGNFSLTETYPIYRGLIDTPGFSFRSVIGGSKHALAIRDDGTLWSMGDNTFGQLGIGTNTYSSFLKPVMTNLTWKTASAYYHNLAICTDGTLWYWGYVAGSAIARTPQQISTNTTWKAVAAGYKHSLALQEDGSLWAWGDNTYGQLGLSPFRQYGTGGSWKPPTPR